MNDQPTGPGLAAIYQAALAEEMRLEALPDHERDPVVYAAAQKATIKAFNAVAKAARQALKGFA